MPTPPIKDPLLKLIVQSTPKALLEQMALRLDAAYQEAADYAQAGPWFAPQSKWMRYSARRAIMEAELRKAAESAGLNVFDKAHNGAGCDYVLVRSGEVNFTCHYVAGPRQGPRFAVARRQNTAVNEWVDGFLEGALNEQPPSLAHQRTHVYILHGEELGSQDCEERFPNRFLRVAVPEWRQDREILRKNWALGEILDAYEVLMPQSMPDQQEDRARTALKKIAKIQDDVG